MQLIFLDINGLMQDCSKSIANKVELLQSGTEPFIFSSSPYSLAVDLGVMSCQI